MTQVTHGLHVTCGLQEDVMRSEVEEAEDRGQKRALIFYMMAAVLVLGALVNFGSDYHGARLAIWLAMIVAIAINLLPQTPVLRRRGVVRLLNDETTRQHRQVSCTNGFWAALAATLVMTIVADFGRARPFDMALVTVTAALTAALISFATLERRAAH